jgi:hypothetical protein
LVQLLGTLSVDNALPVGRATLVKLLPRSSPPRISSHPLIDNRADDGFHYFGGAGARLVSLITTLSTA